MTDNDHDPDEVRARAPGLPKDGGSMRDLMAAAGVSRQTIHTWKERGWVVYTPNGYIDVDASMRRAGSRRSAIGGDRDKPTDADLDGARLDKELALARKHWLEVFEKEGQLIPLAQARLEWGSAIRALRDKCLAVPDRIAAQVAAQSDIGVCRLLIDDAIREALTAASEEPPELSR
jgi:hypothetical protein